jgi:hypothetical protein
MTRPEKTDCSASIFVLFFQRRIVAGRTSGAVKG